MILCFDIGGSRIKAGRAGADGAVVPLGAVPTPLEDFAAFARALSGFAGDWTQGIAISIAGVVDPDSGRIKVANIPCLNGRSLAEELGRAAMQGSAGSSLRILAVTILTSLDRADLDANMIRAGDLAEITLERAARALEAGAHGVIASPHEAALIRALPQAKGRLIVTPGVRPAGAEAGDQKRIASPGQAIRDGADHIVVGRPVWQAADPRAAARAIVAELPARG